MDEPVSSPEPDRERDHGGLRDAVARSLLAALGVADLTKERADELADELAQRGKITRDEARELSDEVFRRWRGDAVRVTERASVTLSGLFRELGLVTRREYEELELRLAQLEHRLRLVESPPTETTEPTEITPPGP
jgi:polyhydroxyalkanoate synthesis regulator phasin